MQHGFSLLIFILYHSPSSWSHRKWVLERLLVLAQDSNAESVWLIREEFNLCTMVAERYPKNYYAWTHRLYCVRQAEPTLLNEEWEFVLAWLPKHVSDHSAVHYGGQVLLQMVQVYNGLEMIDVIESGMQEGKRLVQMHPAHEVLWIFRRVCAHVYLQFLEKSDDCKQIQPLRCSFVQHIEEEWNEVQQLQRPKIGSELELEWRKTQVYRLSYVVWVARHCRLVDNHIREQAIQSLSECYFISNNLWRLTDTGLS